ncbi:MraY family glycosyltransferase [Deinococcus radiodurans]|jgi:UDP-N-acetylmuramyl pentapeptide phosphotransferase/UDP-N-acetylglucosamine-1-phosphate transferase|uniref:Undecaprenyl-phosphate alpha-N-acetylglucosaminyltransferase, putative n=1 Tax=Deinococcus radiodurans (strain ATCC 13939 / DSM 20539 / JCM 16871 / CCUG 27074 / LMG 4051 / NBRC 15346 / NCIMB 9279 / VKM B-1422 / R1) TaxID=243230 RepID=Q9RU33_DEIRA|nr:MraY family glycosyltransferase [Deinococcus radiodurans]AAF11126.1 undecaprenyl-phosphate alpha-N-acetylglucosaminyltransferase, putative [Deinococcus radiodurans R1 = ATCC 13939 = DSM 20539]ANC71319.1 undecaprenyl-phosphate alpha-N-acetylglucosaminyl 1-phosphate transferase [Deinococcus radiodurans R1 = ATCC 13939 = DSM 20539]QEM71000.1 undecaprenyl/decaprenyl-phosphate alpha-N-acetylglucosaminyl 1-phosphate transferase [Deinococcus radiodurans]QIP29556.1 undecaprenyl/decaprenyl-phosphate 
MDSLRALAAQLGIADPFGAGFLSVLVTFVTALLFTWFFMPRLREFAVQAGWADMPNARRLNKEPLPNAGGLGIFAGFIVSIIVAWAIRPIAVELVNIQVLAIMLGATLMMFLGFIDDRADLSPALRLVVQVLAAVLLMVNGLKMDFNAIPFLPTLPDVVNDPLSTVLTILWIVGLTNAVNLMDGVDGVVGGLGFIVSMVLLITAAQFSDRAAAVVLLAGLAGACLGYLRYNFSPSRIILGGGSYLIGFTLAAVSLLGTLKVSAGASLIVPLIVLALPVMDTTQVVIGRLRRGIRNPLGHPDKTHIHHRVLARTASARRTAVILWGVALLCGVAGMLLQGVKPLVVAVAALVIALSLGAVARLRVRAHERERAPHLN